MKTIGQKIKELRRSKGLSQQDIAKKLGVTSQAVSKWETDSSLPEMTLLPDIASLFGVQIDDLFEYSAEKRYESIQAKIEFGKSLSNTEFDNEENFLLKEIKSSPTNHEAICLLSRLYRHQAESLNKKVVLYAKKALEIEPNNKVDIDNINYGLGGKIHDWIVTDHQELVDDLHRILRSEPKNKNIYFTLLDNLIDSGRLQEAKEVLLASMKYNTDTRNEFYDIYIKECGSSFDSVKKLYQQLAAKYSNDWKVLSHIAGIFSYHENYSDAIKYWQMVFDCLPHPRFTDPLESMALCCLRMGDNKSATKYYKKMLNLLRTDWHANYGSEVERIKEKIRQLQ